MVASELLMSVQKGPASTVRAEVHPNHLTLKVRYDLAATVAALL